MNNPNYLKPIELQFDNRNKLLNLFLFVICIIISDLSASERPLMMFASSWNSSAVEIVVNNFEQEDLLGSNLASGKTKTFTLPSDLQKVEIHSRRKNLPTVVIYDPEHWLHTPPKERDNILQSIEKGEKIIHSSSSVKYGIAPDGPYIGLMPKACEAVPSYLLNELNWSRIDYFVIQAQRLLSERCGGKKNIKNYVSFVKKWSEEIKKYNPNCKVFASMSFRLADVTTMKEAIKNTHKFIDGYYLAYPNPKKGIKCKYCTPSNLSSIIQYIKIQEYDK